MITAWLSQRIRSLSGEKSVLNHEQNKRDSLVTIECRLLNQIVSKWGNDSPEFPDNPHRKKTLGERHVGISPEGIYIYGRNRSNEKGTLEGIGEATVCIDNHGL